MNFFPKNASSAMAEIVLRFLFSFLFQPWNSVSHIIVTQDLLIEGAKNI